MKRLPPPPAAPEVRAVQPEILGPNDPDPFTKPPDPEPSPEYLDQQAWIKQHMAYNQAARQPDPIHGQPVGRPDPDAVRERFMEAYGYRFDRHGKLRFP